MENLDEPQTVGDILMPEDEIVATVLPSHARVIIGGGLMGCGLAYHLAHEG